MAAKPNTDSHQKNNLAFLRYSGMAFQMMGAMLLPIALGYFLDHSFDFAFPWGVLIGSLSGVFLALYTVMKMLK
ncbi:MAG: AtpZ/AtpI family protein [Bacteroidia bacterium]